MYKTLRRRSLALLAVLPLAGCFQDTASYTFPEKDHGITLVRTQDWPWQDTLNLGVIAIRLPDCNEGITVKDVPKASEYTLYRAPEGYAEPIFILAFDKADYAIGTQSCQVQKFETAPADLGVKLGVFREVDGKFRFVPAGKA